MRDRIELNPLRAFDSAHEGTLAVMREAPRLLDELDSDDAEHFAQVRELLDRAELSYEVDPTLVRGLDYYSRTVFEFTSDALGAQSGVGGGGRYDGLVASTGGPATPGMGWAAGIERILLAGGPPAAGAAVPWTCTWGWILGRGWCVPSVRRLAFGILSEARSAGLAAQMEMAGRSLKGQLGHANRVGARYVAIVGERGTLLKDMQDGTRRGSTATRWCTPCCADCESWPSSMSPAVHVVFPTARAFGSVQRSSRRLTPGAKMPKGEAMSQVSRPTQIALGAVLLFGARVGGGVARASPSTPANRLLRALPHAPAASAKARDQELSADRTARKGRAVPLAPKHPASAQTTHKTSSSGVRTSSTRTREPHRRQAAHMAQGGGAGRTASRSRP